MDSPPQSLLNPTPSPSALRLHFAGRRLRDLPAPAAVVDVAAVRRNCRAQLNTVRRLGLKFRAHVKTHKTVELARLQVGAESDDVRLICSTVAEAEHLAPWLLECREQGKKVNILHGLPVAPSAIPRLARIARLLGPGSVSVLVDHEAQIEHLHAHMRANPTAWPAGPVAVLVKIDTGYHRAGVEPDSAALTAVVAAVAAARPHPPHPGLYIAGAYAHHGHSYGSSSPADALAHLGTELSQARAGAESVARLLASHGLLDPRRKLHVSVGATPTATATQDLSAASPASADVSALIAAVNADFELEVHAGVYPVLDMQQLATGARGGPALSAEALALRLLVEVVSVYAGRGEGGAPEALVAAGSMAFGREPCKSYPGWGVVTGWSSAGGRGAGKVYDPAGERTGWILGRISQEHGILTWAGDRAAARELVVGEKIMLWPNHACMAGPNFGWYFVVDGEVDGGETVVDCWVRCKGW